MLTSHSLVSPGRFMAAKGLNMAQGLIAVLVAVVVILSVYAIARSLDTQHKVAQTFSGWYEDKKGYDKAVADQTATHRPMLVYIYAPWCPHCKEFSADVLSDPTMVNFVKAYPHVRVAPDHGKAEKAIMDDFGVEGYPSFFAVMPNGKRTKIETFIILPGNKPHLRDAKEFAAAIKEATGGV